MTLQRNMPTAGEPPIWGESCQNLRTSREHKGKSSSNPQNTQKVQLAGRVRENSSEIRENRFGHIRKQIQKTQLVTERGNP